MMITNRFWLTKVACVAFLFAAALFSSSQATAETIQTAATGQKACYSEMGNTISCEGTGQDGEFLAGAQWPAARFAANWDGCWIGDTLTGLMWARNAKQNCTLAWVDAMKYAENLSLCGYPDWRVANINELESLVNAGAANLSAWLTALGFTNLQTGYYFSSTSYLNNNSNYPSPWSMAMQDGTGTGGPTTSGSPIPTKTATACILLVRGGYNPNSPSRVPQTGQIACYDEFNVETPCTGTGQDGYYQTGAAWSATRFDDNQDQTITDQFTNLMWTLDAQTPGPVGDPNLDPVLCVPAEKKTWQDALDYVKFCLNSATDPFLGYRDWRLPNKNELASLLDRSQVIPALPSGNPFGDSVIAADGSGGHWTSTTFLRNRSSAWIVDMNYGDILPNPKAGQQMLHVWPVRGGYPMLTTVVADEAVFPVTGASKVLKSSAGADCSTYCDPNLCALTPLDEWPEGSERYNQGKNVTLTAKPQKGSVFAGWSGYDPCNGKKGSCTVTMSEDLTVTANFSSAPTAVMSPPVAKNFGRVKVNKTVFATFTVRNTTANGKQDLTVDTISDAAISGVDVDQFSIDPTRNKCATQADPYVLKAGKSCTFRVAFTPTTTGDKTATLTISSDDPDANRSSISVTLTGQGKP
jgi:hypothetical protein